MSLNSQVTITWAGTAYGGASASKQIDGAYVMDRAYDHMRLTFNVILVGATAAARQTLAEALEVNFSKRDEDLTVNVGGTSFTFTAGTDYHNPTSSCTKTGQSMTDRGASVAYTCVVEANMPSTNPGTGLVSLEPTVDYEVGRRALATLAGVYTRLSPALSASDNYLDVGGADAEATTFLDSLGTPPTSSMELVDEQYTYDRLDNICQWTRQWQEILFNQVQGTLDSTKIRDHRVTFTETTQHPGDGKEGITRLRRVVGTYDCALDVRVATDVKATFESDVLPHIKAHFTSTFSPSEWCVEDHRHSYDETAKRMSVSIQFLFVPSDSGSQIIEIRQNSSYKELRTLDETPVHGGGEFEKYIDVGWASVERVTQRVVTAVGDMEPVRRLGRTPPPGLIRPLKFRGKEQPNYKVPDTGWVVVNNISQVEDMWIGNPNENQIKTSILTETMVERFYEKPGGTTR